MIKRNLRKSFIDIFKEKLGESPKNSEIIDALSVLDNKCKSFTSGDPDSQAHIRMENEIVEFTDFFYDKYMKDDALFDDIRRRWPDGPPYIFELSDFIMHNKMIEQYTQMYYEDFNDVRKRNCDLLLNYLLDIRLDRNITFLFKDFSPTYFIKKTEKKNKLEDIKISLFATVVRFFNDGGVMVFKKISEKRSVIEGFRSYGNGSIVPVPRDTLKNIHNSQSDGSFEECDSVSYGIAPLLFAKEL